MMNKLMKKITIALAAATIATAAAPAATFANDGVRVETTATTSRITLKRMKAIKYVSNKAGANVRTAPNLNARIVKNLPNKTKVQVTGKTSNGWYQVYMTDKTLGTRYFYISANLLVDTKPGSTGTNTGSKQATKKQYRVKVNDSSSYLILRNAPTKDADSIIGRLYNGDTVHVIKGSGTYWLVSVDKNGRRGYVCSDYLV